MSTGQVGSETEHWAKWYAIGLDKEERSWLVGPDPEEIFLGQVRKSLNRTKKLLDIGCGTGETVEAIASRVGEAWGVDTSKRLIEVAEKDSPANVHFRVADGRRLPFTDKNFDVVICQRGLATENLRFASEMSRVLKNRGVFIAIAIGETDKENIKRVFKRGQLYASMLRGKTEADRHVALLKRLGFNPVIVKEYNPTEYFATVDDLVLRLETTPIIPSFHRVNDKQALKIVEKSLFNDRGLRTNSHRLIVKAVKKQSDHEPRRVSKC